MPDVPIKVVDLFFNELLTYASGKRCLTNDDARDAARLEEKRLEREQMGAMT